MAKIFDMPPALSGDEREQTAQLYRYLMQMSEQLNETVSTLSREGEKGETIVLETGGGRSVSTGSGASAAETNKQRNALRSMIIKTAEIVRTEMQEIRTTLEGSIEAQSSIFGDMTTKMRNDIEINALGVSQNYTYYEELNGATAELGHFKSTISERIFSGAIGTDTETGLPIYGLAIGENVTAYDADGNPYINDNAKMATFTKDKLSFWQGETEVAYFSDKKLYITQAEVTNEMKMGNFIWKVQQDGSLGLIVATE